MLGAFISSISRLLLFSLSASANQEKIWQNIVKLQNSSLRMQVHAVSAWKSVKFVVKIPMNAKYNLWH